MPDRLMHVALGVWLTTLVALLTVGGQAGDTAVLVLFGVMISSAAFLVAGCFGVVRLVRLLVAALALGAGVAAMAQLLSLELPTGGWIGVMVGLAFAAHSRRQRRRARLAAG